MDRKQPVFDFLDARGIRYEWYEHPEAPTIEIARQWWRDDGSKHCKNLFFRNHKGDRHYLVCFDCDRSLAIHDLERRLRQGKLTFASPQRMERYLGLDPAVYECNSIIADAPRLTRPLMLIHGFADDNVTIAHSLRLSQALMAAGREHTFLPLTGITHMTNDETVAENLLLLQRDFLRKALAD